MFLVILVLILSCVQLRCLSDSPAASFISRGFEVPSSGDSRGRSPAARAATTFFIC